MKLSEIIVNIVDFMPKNLMAVCVTHGETDHWQVAHHKPTCRKCEASYKSIASKEKARAVYQAYNHIMVENGVNPNGKCFDAWEFDDKHGYKQKKIIDTLKSIAAKLSVFTSNNASVPNIIVMGGTGTGKTMLVNALLKSVYRKAADVEIAKQVDMYQASKGCAKLIKSRDITEQSKATWGNKKSNEYQLIEHLVAFELLVIDDLGDNDTSSNIDMAANDRGRIAQIIDKRYQKRPTIITTNLKIDGVVSHLGDRAWDRLQENLIIIECGWGSYRQLKAKVAHL